MLQAIDPDTIHGTYVRRSSFTPRAAAVACRATMSGDLSGKTILVTGATEGIGKTAALDFARRGATLVIVGRNAEKTERVRADLERESAHPVEAIVGDLSLVSETRRVARDFLAKHDRLDVLVNNAGALFQSRRLTAEGYEMTFALNHLGYFVLTEELLPVLTKTPGARIVSTASGAHASGKLHLDDVVRREKGYFGLEVYGSSKLANILFTREIATRLKGTAVTANCFHPGFVSTGFGSANGFVSPFIKLGAVLFGRNAEKGAETLIWLATSPEASSFTGEYFMDKKTAGRTKAAKDDVLARRLWDLTAELLASNAA
jgi:retinol dehydrogenase 12